MITVKLSGFEKLQKVLTKLPQNIQNNVLQKATTAALEESLPQLIAAAPYDSSLDRSPISQKYGHLRENIHVENKKKHSRGQRGAIFSTGNAPQGLWAEKGTRHEAARPWFLPTFTRLQEPILTALRLRITDGLLDEAEKLK